MTQYEFADMPQWAAKMGKVFDAIVKQATNDLLAGVNPGPSISRTGYREHGTIPVKDGFLVNSLQSSLYGGTAITGAEGWIMVVGKMKVGDTARFMWGGHIAPYARHVHYGAKGVAGTFWVDVAAGKWPQYVDGAAAKALAQWS